MCACPGSAARSRPPHGPRPTRRVGSPDAPWRPCVGAGDPHTRGALLGASASGTPLPLRCYCSSAPRGGAGSVHLRERIPSSGRAPSLPFPRVLRWPFRFLLLWGQPRRKLPVRLPGPAPLCATSAPHISPSCPWQIPSFGPPQKQPPASCRQPGSSQGDPEPRLVPPHNCHHETVPGSALRSPHPIASLLTGMLPPPESKSKRCAQRRCVISCVSTCSIPHPLLISRHTAKMMGLIGGWKILNQWEMYGLGDLWITQVPWHEKCENIYSP